MLAVTGRLVADHPLALQELKAACLSAWNLVWSTTVGKPPLSLQLDELDVPAPVVGYFFEVLLAKELATRQPGVWRRNTAKDEMDVVCLTNPDHSFEIKTSGQLAFKIFGNRSYGQKPEDGHEAKKEKSGYYATVNFVGQVLTLIRFGWIDADDWSPQASQRGQAATLRDAVYGYKLVPVPGAYRRDGPVQLLDEIGPVTAAELAQLSIHTIGDLIDRSSALSPRLGRIVEKNREFLDGCSDRPAT